MVPELGGRQGRGEGMGDVDRTDHVDAQHAVPVGRRQVPEREAELARADADREDNMIDPAKGDGRLGGGPAHRLEIGHVGNEGQGGDPVIFLDPPGGGRHFRRPGRSG